MSRNEGIHAAVAEAAIYAAAHCAMVVIAAAMLLLPWRRRGDLPATVRALIARLNQATGHPL